MKRALILNTALVAVFGSVALYAAASGQAPETCVLRKPETSPGGVGYEVIDLMRREAWVTTDWTLDDYAAFSPPVPQVHWIKNDPRASHAARTAVLRSPGCPNDGKFTHQDMFGRSFFHIADLVSFGPRHGLTGELREAGVVKYHRLDFEVGQTVPILRSPDGDRFVLVNRLVGLEAMFPGLPEGWARDEVTLDAPWRVDLFGQVRVLQLQDGSSFQGPVDLPTETRAQTANADGGR